MNTFERPHPVTVVFNLGRVFYLIIIPVLRGFFSALNGGFARWARGAWIDIAVFALMLAIAAAAWLAVKFRLDGGRLEIEHGLLTRRKTMIPWNQVTTVTLLESFYLRPFRAVRLRVDTLGGSFKSSDFSLLLTSRQAKYVTENRDTFAGEPFGKVYQPTTRSIVALSLLTSNSFGGILFISAFISQSGKLLGREFSEMIIGTFEQASRRLSFGITPAAAAIGYILLAGWFIGFLLSFIRYKDFTLTRREYILHINGGILTKREYYIRYSNINFVDIRQSITTKLLRLYSLYISAVGYGKHKDDISCIIPTEPEAEFRGNYNKIFPSYAPSPPKYTPGPRGFTRFISAPVSLLAGIAAGLFAFLRLFPSWSGFISFVGFMAAVPALFFLLIRILDYKTGGLSYENGHYIMRYSSGLTLHTVVIPADKVVSVELSQSFFQKSGPYCDLLVSSRAEKRSLHRCRNLVKSDLIRLFQLTNL